LCRSTGILRRPIAVTNVRTPAGGLCHDKRGASRLEDFVTSSRRTADENIQLKATKWID
jgi:hypothetical protein